MAVDAPDHNAPGYVPVQPIENLVFEGGGVKGLGYVSVVNVFQEKNLLEKVKRVAGSSAGGIIAMLLGLGYTAAEIEDEMSKMDFTQFQDAGKEYWKLFPKGIFSHKILQHTEDFLNFLFKKDHGVYRGEAFHNWAKAMIAKKLGNPNATFRDLREALKVNNKLKDMMFTGSLISGDRAALQYFDGDTTPDVEIADAVRATMSFPGGFEPFKIKLHPSDREPSIFVDGGLLSNFPVEYYEQEKFISELPASAISKTGANKRTLAVRVDSKEEIETYKWNVRGKAKDLSKLSNYVLGIADAVLSFDDRRKLYDRYGMATIQIDDGDIPTLKFDLTEDEKQLLLDNGEKATRDWFLLYRPANVVEEVKNYEDLRALYEEKSEQEKRESIAKLQERYRRLEQKPSSDKIKEKMADILKELKVIRDISPNLFLKKTDEEIAREKAHEFMNIKHRLAQANLETLLKIQKIYTQAIADYRTLLGRAEHQIDVLKEILTHPRVNALLKEAFQKIEQLHKQFVEQKSNIEKKSLMGEAVNPKELEAIESAYDKSVQKISDELTDSLEKISLSEDKKLFVKRLMENEIKRTKKEDQPCDPEKIMPELEKRRNQHFKELSALITAKNLCDRKIDKCKKTQHRLEYQIKEAGESFPKMIKCAADLTKYIKEQDNIFVSAYELSVKAVRGLHQILKVATFGILPLAEMAVKWGSRALGLTERLEQLGVTEDLFVPNKVLYRRQAIQLRRDIRQIVNEWGASEPRENLKSYNKALKKPASVLLPVQV